MKKYGYYVLLVCLALIGLLAGRDGAFVSSPLPTFVTSAVSANNLPAFINGDQQALAGEVELADGERVFERECTLCHSAPLVFKSHVLAGDVDSLVNSMLRKDRVELPEPETSKLAAYLKTRLPKK